MNCSITCGFVEETVDCGITCGCVEGTTGLFNRANPAMRVILRIDFEDFLKTIPFLLHLCYANRQHASYSSLGFA